MNISLPESMKKFVDRQVAAKSYGSVSEYVRALIREDQQRVAQSRMESLLLEGLESGEPVEMTKADWDEIRREAALRLKTRKKSA